jgi:hypothetical protein
MAAWLISDQAVSASSEALMEHRDRLLIVAWIAATAVLSGSALAQNTPQPLAPVAAQSACPETLPDVDRVACLVSLAPEAAPARPKPQPPLLRGPDGTTIIGPKPSH